MVIFQDQRYNLTISEAKMFLFDKNEIVRRLKKYPILQNFSEFALRKLVAQSQTLELMDNQVLFYPAEASDSVYYVIDGHIEGFSSENFQRKVVDIHRGEMVGEMGVVSGEPRGFVTKSRGSSQLLKIEREVFLNFFQKNPTLLMLLTQTVAKRLRRVIMDLRDAHYPYKNIGVIVLSDGLLLDEMKANFKKNALIDNAYFYEHADFCSTKLELVSFFYQCEDNSGVNLFWANYTEEKWCKAVLDHVDYIYFLVRERDSDALTLDKIQAIKQRPSDIVIMHSRKGPYKDTAQFYAKFAFKRHHHITQERADFERLYRYITGQAIGLVCSGGGYRGAIHYGLAKALFEAEIPIDCIGGSSVGSCVGAMISLYYGDWPSFDKALTEAMQIFKHTRLFKHITIPLVSILNGEVATRTIRHVFQEAHIEDLPINFFCVVGNLSKSQKEICTTGLLKEWLRGSVAIPGVMPPFEKDGVIYVDGSVCANLPVEEMRGYLNQVGTTIAFDIRTHLCHQTNYHFPPILRFKDILRYKLGFSKNRYVLPNLSDIVMESSFINQYAIEARGNNRADIIIAPDTSFFSHHEAKKSDTVRMFAYEFAREKLKEYKSVYERWIVK